MSISPEPSSSRTSRAFLRRAGCSRNWRFSSPQFLRNLITSSSVFTAFTISAVDSVPPPSLSMSSKHFRAALRKSPVNSAISRCAARALSSRFAARSASLFLSAISIHSSLRETSTGEPRHHRNAPSPRRRDPKGSDAEAHHSSMSICPSRSVSISASALSRRDGTNKYCKFLLPQLIRKLMTFWFLRRVRVSPFSVPWSRAAQVEAERTPCQDYP